MDQRQQRVYHAAARPRRLLLLDLDRGTYDLPNAEFHDLAALRRAAIAALRAARVAMTMAVVGGAR
jgi:hypothetical protein